MRRAVTFGEGLLLEKYWLPTQQSKKSNSDFTFEIIFPAISNYKNSLSANVVIQSVVENVDVDVSSYERKIDKILKNVIEQDLGMMDATILVPAIKDSNSGWNDLQNLEHDLGVKMFFCVETTEEDAKGETTTTDSHGKMYVADHIYLIGAKKKLDKKCSDLRNLLSHFHWRLAGRDISFEEMTAKK